MFITIGLLASSRANKEKYDKERLDDYYTRNFKVGVSRPQSFFYEERFLLSFVGRKGSDSFSYIFDKI